MYQVAQHREGIKGAIHPNGLLWEQDIGGHEWWVIWQGRRKADAITIANDAPMHATVVIASTSDIIHDNGKPPGSRIVDHRLDKSIPIRAARDLASYRL